MQLLYHPIIPLSFGFHLMFFQFSLKRGHDILTRNERRRKKCNIRYRKSWTNKKLALTYGSLNRTIIYIRRFKIFLADSTDLVSNRLSQFHYTYVNISTNKLQVSHISIIFLSSKRPLQIEFSLSTLLCVATRR